jgi:two-component system response regulator FixJ
MQADGIVHVIDDDEAMRDSLVFLLKSAKIPVKAYEGAVAFLSRMPTDSGCVITDVRMPEMSGIDLLKRLRQMKNPVPVIIITGHGDVPLAVEAMKCGASDFLEKPFDDELLLTAVRTALSNQVAEHQNQALRLNIEQRIARVSARERQVLDGLVAGHPNKTIAFDLGISPRTIEIYRANVMSKMEAASLSDLVRMALTAGILGQDSDQDSGQDSGTDSPPSSG